MEPRPYKHTKRLIILHVLSVLFIFMEWYASGKPDVAISFIIFIPITFAVWIWTFLADITLLAKWVIRRLGLHMPKWLLKDVSFRKN
jgi:hypothetical protein